MKLRVGRDTESADVCLQKIMQRWNKLLGVHVVQIAIRSWSKVVSQAHFPLCLPQVELELDSLKKQQASAAESTSSISKEEISNLR